MRVVTFLTIVLCATANSYGQGEVFLEQLMHDGVPRTYWLYVPSAHTTNSSFPLVVAIHGNGSSGQSQLLISDMNSVAEQEGFLVAYPNGIGGRWLEGPDDIGFIDALITEVSSAFNVDQSRLYATGMSRGGLMSYVLAVARPDQFAAIAPVAGARYFESGVLFPPDLPALPNRPFPLLHIHGTADTIVDYYGGLQPSGKDRPAIEDVVSDWVAHNGGEEALHFTRLPDVDPNDGTTVDLYSCSDCGTYVGFSGEERVAEVLFYRINNGGHNWPGDWGPWPAWAEPVSYDISGSAVVWDFFSQHELPIPEPASTTLLGIGLMAILFRRFPI